MEAKPMPAPQRLPKIWIDLDNSPHVLFFTPIIRELRMRGYPVMITARNFAQVCGLADLYHLEYRAIGRHYGRHKLLKAMGLVIRTLQMLPILLRERPRLAFSHGSRSQILAAKFFGIPSLEAFDYEYAKGLALVQPTRVMVPALLSNSRLKASGWRVIKYPGIKEDVYIQNFQPDPGILTTLGIREGEILVTVRPPATHAHYHNPRADNVFEAVMNFALQTPATRIVLLPRTAEQQREIQATWPEAFQREQIIIPRQVVNGLNLLWHSDVAISGGGTMIREAAALGVPAYSFFAGRKGAVDQFLENSGRLTFLDGVEAVPQTLALRRRQRPPHIQHFNKAVLDTIVNEVETMIKAA